MSGLKIKKLKNQTNVKIIPNCLACGIMPELKFANEPGRYDSQNYCYFKLTNGQELKLSYKDCLEVAKTVMDVRPMPFDRDEIVWQMEEEIFGA